MTAPDQFTPLDALAEKWDRIAAQHHGKGMSAHAQHREWCADDLRAAIAEARALAPETVGTVEARIDNLRNVADRFDHPGGSRRLAQRARDKADGMETALRLLGGTEVPGG